MSSCAYRIMLDRVNTKDKLRKWGMDIDEQCVLYEE